VTFEVHRVIAKDHPALAGHFPGNPIVPGVLILDEVLQVAEQWRGKLRLKSVISVKFIFPLKPGVAFSIKLHEEDRSRIAFECWLDGTALASGRLVVEPDAGGP
jgi:3-hydroxymyristoyl/3-hydroxydecanoyl-(acyl carrier protein) dehydratase